MRIRAIVTAMVTGRPGDLIACRETKLPHITGNVPMKAWKIQYVSENAQGEKISVSGFVAIPEKAWDGEGSRPTIAFTPGTLGNGQQCAMSKQMSGEPEPGYVDAYEAPTPCGPPSGRVRTPPS